MGNSAFFMNGIPLCDDASEKKKKSFLLTKVSKDEYNLSVKVPLSGLLQWSCLFSSVSAPLTSVDRACVHSRDACAR